MSTRFGLGLLAASVIAAAIFVSLWISRGEDSQQAAKAHDEFVHGTLKRANTRFDQTVTVIDHYVDRSSGGFVPGIGREVARDSWELVCRWGGNTTQARAIERHKGHIYVTTGGNDGGQGLGRVWRVSENGCKDVTPWNDSADRVPGLMSNGQYIYAGMGRFSGSGELWRSEDGDNWERILTLTKNERWPGAITRFKKTVCVGTDALRGGARVICNLPSGWATVLRLSRTSVAYALAQHADALYLGTAYPASIQRTADLENWEKVVAFPKEVSHVETFTDMGAYLIYGVGRKLSERNATFVRALFDDKNTPLGASYPAEFYLSHNFNASTKIGEQPVVTMGSTIGRLSVWALGGNGAYYLLGRRPDGDWRGAGVAARPYTGEWIYDAEYIDGFLYVSFAGDPGDPSLWRMKVSTGQHQKPAKVQQR